MVWTGPVGQKYGPGFGPSWYPPSVHLDEHLTDDDVAWLNGQLELVDSPTVRFLREIKPPPPPSGLRRGELAGQAAIDIEQAKRDVAQAAADLKHAIRAGRRPSDGLLLPSERIR